MKPFARLWIAGVVFLLAIIFAFGIAQALGQDGGWMPAGTSTLPATQPWTGQYVHRVTNPPVSAGSHNSIAFSWRDYQPYISYYDATNGDLMLATPDTTGQFGNCGKDNSWFCRLLDSEGDVGQYSSIAIWKNPALQWKLGISYYDKTNAALKYAAWSCVGDVCGWKIETISDSPLLTIAIGQHTSLKYGSDGTAHIAYLSTSALSGTRSLRYAYSVSDGGNCGEGSSAGKWQCGMVDSGSNRLLYMSLDLDYENRVHIAYFDETLGNLKHAFYNGFGGNCGDGLEWKCDIVDGLFAHNAGLYPSIRAPRATGEKVRIAYYDKTYQKLRYAVQGTGGDCGLGWICQDVDDMGSSLAHMGIALELDPEGNPFIAYQKVPEEEISRSILKIARPYFVYEDGNFGNCGEVPPGYLFNYWRCSSLDNAGAYVDEGEYVSLAVFPTGRAMVAYSEWDDYYEVTSLKVMYQYEPPNLVFVPMLRK
jgi:hypothetical protein